MKDKNEKIESILISGNSKFSKNNPDGHVYENCCILLEINPDDNKIISASHSSISELLTKIFNNYLINNEIEFGIKNTIHYIEANFFSPSKKAVTYALENILKKYKNLLRDKNNNLSEEPLIKDQNKLFGKNNNEYENFLRNIETRETKKTETDNSKNSYLTFLINDNRFAINSNNIEQIIKISEIKKYPDISIDDFKHHLRYKHNNINIVDLSFNADIKNKNSSNQSIIIVNNNNLLSGIIVDNVIDKISIPLDKIELKNNFILSSNYKIFSSGIYNINNQQIKILDLDKTEFKS